MRRHALRVKGGGLPAIDEDPGRVTSYDFFSLVTDDFVKGRYSKGRTVAVDSSQSTNGMRKSTQIS